MPGPGGGPPRRSHTKSRKGCETCKRRHIRCDENFPQCRNCTKHKIRCPYNDVQVTEERSTTPDKPDLMWTPKIEADIAEWQKTGIFPFADTMPIYPAPLPHLYTVEDLRLMYHLASLHEQLTVLDANNFTLWTRHIPSLLRIGATHSYVMHALLAFSAMHIAFLTDCPLVGSVAYEHKGTALSGLQEAIHSFSRENSDAILAASLVLSWQATDWPSWSQLMQGTATVIKAMDGWKHESIFGDFIAESSTFPKAPTSPGSDHKVKQPTEIDMEAFQQCLSQLQRVEAHLKRLQEDTTQVQHLIGFLKGSRKLLHGLSAAQQYERLQPLRTWLFWMPVGYLKTHQGSANSLMVIAHLYTIALLMERLFPDIGAAYFGSLSAMPLEELARRIMSISLSTGAENTWALMEHPVNTVSEFRSRMGWLQPDHMVELSAFDQSSIPFTETGLTPSTDPFTPYGNLAFSYSAEDMSYLNPSGSPSQPAVSPSLLSSPYPSQLYLGVPSPSYAAGAYSPASSTFEGSIVYSDTEDFASFDLGTWSQADSPVFGETHHDNFALGFVTPQQPIWI